MSDLAKAAVRVSVWALLQALAYLAVFEVGKATWAAVYGWQSDLGRGVLWVYALWTFAALALVGNAVLESRRFGPSFRSRLAVWGAVLVPLAVLTVPSASSVPLAVALVWLCVAVAVVAREGLGRLALGHRSFASG